MNEKLKPEDVADMLDGEAGRTDQQAAVHWALGMIVDEHLDMITSALRAQGQGEDMLNVKALDSRRLDWLDHNCSFVADMRYNIGPFPVGELRQMADAGIAADWVNARTAQPSAQGAQSVRIGRMTDEERTGYSQPAPHPALQAAPEQPGDGPVAWRCRFWNSTYGRWDDWRHQAHEPQGDTDGGFQKEPLGPYRGTLPAPPEADLAGVREAPSGFRKDALRYRLWRAMWCAVDDLDAFNALTRTAPYGTPEEWDAVLDAELTARLPETKPQEVAK